MNGNEWLLLPAVVAANLITGYAFFTEKTLNRPSQEQNGSSSKKVKILYSAFAFLINIGIAVLFLTLYKSNTLLFSLKRLFLLSVLWPVGYIDFKTLKIPNRFIMIGLMFRAVILIFELLFERELLSVYLVSEAIAAGVLLLATLLCSLCIKNSIGFGDIKLFAVLGLMLGADGTWSAVFVSLFISFVTAVVLLISGKKGKKDAIPFAPSIAVGTYISIILTGM